MAELDKKKTVTLEELMVSTLAMVDAVTKLDITARDLGARKKGARPKPGSSLLF